MDMILNFREKNYYMLWRRDVKKIIKLKYFFFFKILLSGTQSMKIYAVFVTYITADFKKVVEKMEKQIMELMPDLTKANPGLSIKVEGIVLQKGL
ncbi:MAG: hypothetical protein ACFFG0_21055 [Candidatus Thorarchaeota archaeon]